MKIRVLDMGKEEAIINLQETIFRGICQNEFRRLAVAKIANKEASSHAGWEVGWEVVCMDMMVEGKLW